MKKILTTILILCLLFPFISKAVIYLPYGTLNIKVNTVGGNDNFDFEIRGIYGIFVQMYGEFSLQTVNNTATYENYIDADWGGPSLYIIKQLSKSGWENQKIQCNSDDPNVKFTYSKNQVSFNSPSNQKHIYCNFTNLTQTKRNPVVIIPGVLGTELFKNSEKIWIDGLRMIRDVGDNFMDSLNFKNDLTPLDNSVVKQKVLRKEITFDYTDSLIKDLISQGYTEGKDLFTFPYDWRYGVSGKYEDGKTNSDKLKGEIDYILTQTDAGKQAGKVDVVAHSTGGLIVKKYVMENPAEHHIGKAVFVGVPNTGAPKAIKVLIQGDDFGVAGLSDEEMKKISQNMPVIYDLSPSVRYYNNKGSYVRILTGGLESKDESLNFNEINTWLVNDHQANNLALNQAKDLHTLSYDNFDMRTAGVDLYNIVGCKNMDTIGKITEIREKSRIGTQITGYYPETTPGDGTVPLESSTNLPVDASHKYYALKANHGSMLSQEGIRQQIVNAIANTNLEVKDKYITQDIAKCNLKGRGFSVYSPVNLDITDQEGNHLGFAEDGSLENDIPNAGFHVFGERKFIFLPEDEGQTYNINLKGIGNGTFTIKDQQIDNSQVVKTQVFNSIPVTTQLTGSISSSNGNTILNLDINGDGNVKKEIEPTSVLNETQSQDLTAPVSTSTIVSGVVGKPGYYKSDVNVSLSATDDTEPTSSGLLKTEYRIDNGEWNTATSSAITLASEGNHTLEFYSTDKAGNKEPVKTLNVTIDKTAPEAEFSFDKSTKALSLLALDNISTTTLVSVVKDKNIYKLTDQAGNTSEFEFKTSSSGDTQTIQLNSLTYNSQKQNLKNTAFRLTLNNLPVTDKNFNLNQYVSDSKTGFNLTANYPFTKCTTTLINKKQATTCNTVIPLSTSLSGKDSKGNVNKHLEGLSVIRAKTDKGNFLWSLSTVYLQKPVGY